MATKPNGLLIQWGILKDSSTSNGFTTITQNFYTGITFTQPPTIITDVFANSGDLDLEHCLIYNGIGTSSFKIYRRQYATYRGHTWIAIGY